MKEGASGNSMTKFSFLFNKANMMSKNLFANSLAKNNVVESIINCWDNDCIDNVSCLCISNTFRTSNLDKLLGFIKDKLNLLRMFVVKCKPAAKKFEGYLR